MISFNDDISGIPQYNLNATGVVDNLDGGTSIAFNIPNWATTNANSGTQTSWGLQLNIGDAATPKFQIRSVYINNLDNMFPVFLFFPDSGQMLPCDAFDEMTRRVFTASPYAILFIKLPFTGSFSPFTPVSTFVLLTDSALDGYNRSKPIFKRGSINMLRISSGLVNNDPVQEVVADNFVSGVFAAGTLGSHTTIMGQQANIIRRFGYLCGYRVSARNNLAGAARAQAIIEAVDAATGLASDQIDVFDLGFGGLGTVLIADQTGLQLKFDLSNSVVRLTITIADINIAFAFSAFFGHHAY